MGSNDQERRKRKATNSFVAGDPEALSSRSGANSEDAIAVDDDDVKPEKDDPKDRDYQEMSPVNESQTTRPKTAQRKPKPDDMTREELITEVIKSRKDLTDLRKKRTEDRKDGLKEKTLRKELQKDATKLDEEIDQLKQDRRDLKRAKKEQRDLFDQAQTNLLAKFEKSRYPSLPDNVIRDTFYALATRCREWVREWSKDHLSAESMSFFDNIVARCASTQRSHTKALLLSKLSSGDMVVPRAMCFAWIHRELIQIFFESPFFMFGPFRLAFEEFYKISVQSNPKKAYAWRAETLRSSRDHRGVRPSDLRGETLESGDVLEFCARAATNIIEGNYAVILRKMNDDEIAKRQTELFEICRGFCLLAFELWCQKSNLVVVDDARLFAEAFSLSSTLQQPHVSMGLDDDDRRFDGILPDAALTSAISVFGDAKGDKLDEEKIVSRAIVLIFDKVPLHTTRDLEPALSQIQSQTSEHKLANLRVPDSHRSKKRKLSPEDAPRTRHRAASLDITKFRPTAGSSGSMHSLGQVRPVNQKTSLATILESVDKGDTYDLARRNELHAAMQKKQTQSAPASSSEQSKSSIPHHDRSVSDGPHQPRDSLKNKKHEQQQSERSSSETPHGRMSSDAPPARIDEGKSVEPERAAEGDTIRVIYEITKEETGKAKESRGEVAIEHSVSDKGRENGDEFVV